MQSLNNVAELNGLIATLEAQEAQKKDYVANSTNHLFFTDGALKVVQAGKEVVYQPTQHFHNQIAEKMDIPRGYYNRMLAKSRSLLDDNVNHWLNDYGKNYLVRTFEDAAEGYNTARAFLSDRYSIIDNYQVLMEALESIKETGMRVEVAGAELSDTRMYLKIVCPEVEVEAKEMLKLYRLSLERGANVISGFVIQNSEIGAGSFHIMPRAVVLACKNGMVSTTDSLKRVHLGGQMDELGFNQNEAVMRANLKLIREQVKHAVKVFLSKNFLTKLVEKYTDMGTPKIEAPINNVLEVVGKKYSITEDRKASILDYFVQGGDNRRIGLVNAITHECQGLTNVDARNDAEVSSYELLRNFKEIENAALKLKRDSN